MKIAVAVWLLTVMSSVTARAHQEAMDSPATATSLFPMFITGDLKDEFVTQTIEARDVMWLETPVSIEGSRALREAAQQSAGKIVPVPLVLEHASPDCTRRVASGTRQP